MSPPAAPIKLTSVAPSGIERDRGRTHVIGLTCIRPPIAPKNCQDAECVSRHAGVAPKVSDRTSLPNEAAQAIWRLYYSTSVYVVRRARQIARTLDHPSSRPQRSARRHWLSTRRGAREPNQPPSKQMSLWHQNAPFPLPKLILPELRRKASIVRAICTGRPSDARIGDSDSTY